MDAASRPQTGTSTYIFRTRGQAAKFAYKLSLAEQEAKNQKTSVQSAAWTALKTGLSRKDSVSFDAINTAPGDSRMSKVASSLQTLEETKICTRKATPFEVPVGFQWSTGNAKEWSRQIVVRHWVTPGKQKTSIHTALSMKDKTKDFNEYAAWGPDRMYLGDWSTSENYFKRKLAPLKLKIMEYTNQDFPDSPASYREDKGLYLGTETKSKLIDGVKARQVLKDVAKKLDDRSVTGNDLEVNEKLRQKAKYIPMSFQKASSKDEDEWQRKAQKHYLPCIGYDKHLCTGQNLKQYQEIDRIIL